jgi:hypothetical protein
MIGERSAGLLRFAGRALVAVLILGPWLLLLTNLQTALYPLESPPTPSPVPAPLVAGAIIVTGWLRVQRRTTPAHLLFLVVLVCGVAFLAAHVGSPLANASGEYCGDFCRTAIMGRFLAFFGWPILVAAGLAVLGRLERSRPEAGASERASWSWAWGAVALVLGTLASIAWWRIILPNG